MRVLLLLGLVLVGAACSFEVAPVTVPPPAQDAGVDQAGGQAGSDGAAPDGG